MLELPEKDDGRQDVVSAAVKTWLDVNQGWLFIFDNADTPDLLPDFLPQKQGGHILITSRADNFEALSILEPIELLPFNRKEATEFLLKRALANEERAIEDPDFGIGDAERVAAQLGDLPLALEQAGAVISETGINLKDYAAKFEKQRLHL